jgi:Kef-type K+ transport system membrane component KefB
VSLFGLVVPLALGIAAGMAVPTHLLGTTGDRSLFALYFGVAMCVSAIPVIAKTLSDMNLIGRDVGQLTLAAGVVDDAFGWLLLSLVGAAAAHGFTVGTVSRSLAILVGVIVFAVLVGRPMVHVILRWARRSAVAEPAAAPAVLLILLGAAGTAALGLEAVFGAFVVGVLVGAVPSGGRAVLGPIRVVVLSVLAPIFLATAGLRMDLGKLGDPQVLVAAVVVIAVATAGKLLGAFLGARLSRLTRWEGLALGAAMNARGVVEIVVASVGLRLGVLNTAMYTVIVLMAIVSSLLAPPMLRLAMRRVEQSADERLRLADRSESPHPV